VFFDRPILVCLFFALPAAMHEEHPVVLRDVDAVDRVRYFLLAVEGAAALPSTQSRGIEVPAMRKASVGRQEGVECMILNPKGL
jgi:hypothetical protein